MIDLCEHAVAVGEKKGADEVEALWVRNVYTTVEAELGEISKATTTMDEGIRIRVVKNKALGSVFTYRLGKDDVTAAVEKALAAASASKKDEHWDSLPSLRSYPLVDVWDSTIEAMSSEEIMKPVTEMLELAPQDVAVFLAANQIIVQERACANSNRIAHEDRGTLELVGMAVVGMLENGVTPAFDEILFLRKYNPEPQKIVETLTNRVNLFKKKGEAAATGRLPVIFSPSALESLFRFTLFKAVSGENVARGKSLLSGKEGEIVANPKFTLHDNGIIPTGVYSGEMDDEGVPRQDTPLIEDGVLQGFIWNDYWAKRTGFESTGNAYYEAATDEMVIQQTTMVVTPGDCGTEELFSIKDGYYVLGLQGAHSSNPESGDFSVVCSPAYRVRDGEITGGVTGVMLSDNVFSLIGRIDVLGRETRVGEISVLPHIRFADVNVASR